MFKREYFRDTVVDSPGQVGYSNAFNLVKRSLPP